MFYSNNQDEPATYTVSKVFQNKMGSTKDFSKGLGSVDPKPCDISGPKMVCVFKIGSYYSKFSVFMLSNLRMLRVLLRIHNQ